MVIVTYEIWSKEISSIHLGSRSKHIVGMVKLPFCFCLIVFFVPSKPARLNYFGVTGILKSIYFYH